MPNYRRNYVPGGSYFFTVNLHDRRQDLLVRYWPVLREAMQSVREQRPFVMEALVILPDHLHAIWTLPEEDADFSCRWRAIKSRFTKGIAAFGCPNRVWQPRFWEHTLRDERSFRHHFDYVHLNPVKHDYVTKVADWPYSTFHRYAGKGWYAPDWLGEGE